MIAGCISFDSETSDDETATGDESSSETDDDTESSDETDSTESSEGSDEDIIDEFATILEDRGFERVTVEPVDGGLDLGYDASGTTEDDVAAEIERIADGYTTAIEMGSSSTHLEATAYDPGNGEVLDYFTIETEWIEAYLEGDLEWGELLTRIGETFVSTQSATDGDPGGDDDGDGGEDAGGDDEDPDGGDEDADGDDGDAE